MSAVLAFHRAAWAAPCVPKTPLADAVLRSWALRLDIRRDIARGHLADARADLGRLATQAARAPLPLAVALWADHERLSAALDAAIARGTEEETAEEGAP